MVCRHTPPHWRGTRKLINEGKLRAKLSHTDEAKLAKTPTNNPKAYELYLKGKFYTNQFTRAGFRKGPEYFD